MTSEESHSERLTHLGIKIPITLKKALERFVAYDTHATISDFVRDAIRAYLTANAPGLLDEVVEEARKHQKDELKEVEKLERKKRRLEIRVQ